MSNYLFVCTDVANNVWVPLTPAMLGGGGGGGGGGAGGGTSDTTEATQLAVKVAVQSIEGKTPALSGGAVPVVAAALPLPSLFLFVVVAFRCCRRRRRRNLLLLPRLLPLLRHHLDLPAVVVKTAEIEPLVVEHP